MTDADVDPDEPRLIAYERRTEWPLTIAALLFLVAYALPILRPTMPATSADALDLATWIIWGLFGADYLLRLLLARDRVRFFRRRLFDLTILLLPMLRPLRALRALSALTLVSRRVDTFARGRLVAAVMVAIAAFGAIASLALLDAERDKPSANVTSFGDALWWAATTVTTVGYGDRHPTTTTGRLVAVTLMLAGVALIGVVTGSLSSWFVDKIRSVETAEDANAAKLDEVLSELRAVRAEVAELRSSSAAPAGQRRDAGGDGTA